MLRHKFSSKRLTLTKNTAKIFLQNLSPELYTRLLYRKKFNKKLDLKNPSGFNEKILWLKLYWKHPLVVKCADKYRVREYVKDHGLGFLLPELYGVYENSRQIEWRELPDKFALKCNHGCGYNIICNNKDDLNKEEAKSKLENWLNSDFGYKTNEMHYSKIDPVIIAEEYIEDGQGLLPNDYKIYCFDGEPKLLLACTERATKLRLEFYDLDWNPLDIGAKENEVKAKKPACLDEMVHYARKLSQPFPFVRVDFYDLDSKPIFGEMTFTPAIGMADYYSEKGNEYVGQMLTLPHKYDGNYN